MTDAVIRPAPVRRTFDVRATPAKAFEVFTRGFDRWWPRTHKIGAAPLRQAVLEPHVGGRWYEVGEDGAECQWGEVLAWDPPHRLVLIWRITSAWAYDESAYSEVEVLFTPLDDGSTRVDLEHRMLEGLGDGEAVSRAVDRGWATILEAFKSAAQDS